MTAPAAPARVLMTADAVGGVWQYALELARGLAGRGTDVALAVMGPPPSPAQRADAEAVPGLSLAEGDFALEWMRSAGGDVDRAGDWLLALEAETAPDVVHVNGYAHAALPWRAPCLCVAHSCVASWWRAVKGTEAPAEWDGYRARVARGLAAAGLVAAPTRAFLDEVDRLYGPLPRTAVIRNGRTDPALRPGLKLPLVFAAGRVWDEAKNLAALDAVAAGLAWPVAVAGDTAGPDGAHRPLQYARALGRLSAADTAAWMVRAAVFALPARYEPFGLAVLEAALAGCALVLGDIATLRELWDGVAVFVDPDDPAALRAALEGLIADPGRTETLGLSARARALTLSRAAMTDGYLEAYARLATADAPAAGRAA